MEVNAPIGPSLGKTREGNFYSEEPVRAGMGMAFRNPEISITMLAAGDTPYLVGGKLEFPLWACAPDQ